MKQLHTYMAMLAAGFFLLLTPVAHADKLGHYNGIAGLAVSFNQDDGYRVVIVGESNGDLHEIYYRAGSSLESPRELHSSIIAHFDGIVGVAAFYNKDDHYRVAIVATSDGNIHEIFYHPHHGIGKSVIGNYPGVTGITGFFNDDDNYRVVIIATDSGDVHELFYHPKKGRGTSVIGHFDGIIGIAGTFLTKTKDRCVLVLLQDGQLHQIIYNPKRGKRQSQVSNVDTSEGFRSLTVRDTDFFASSPSRIVRFRYSPSSATAGAVDVINVAATHVAVDNQPNPNLVYALTNGDVYQFRQQPPTPAPKIQSFTASPNDGYINVGSSATLNWQTSNCAGIAAVSLVGQDGLGYATQAMSVTGLPVSGSFTVTPTRSTLTRYTLTVACSNGSHSANKVVQLYGPPKIGKVFYFRLTNSQSAGAKCFTIAIVAPDQTTAKQLAEQQNGGFKAESITEQEFLAGCN